MSALPGTTGRRRIYLMRHGHVDYFGKEIQAAGGDTKVVPLTPLGQEQAKAGGVALSHVRFDRAVCSGVPRTFQTATHVLASQPEELRPALEVEPDLVEIHGGGFIEAKSRAELAAQMAYHFEVAGEPGATMLKGGEVFADAERRAIEAVKRLLAEPGWHTVLIAAHEGINRLILGWAALGAKGSGLKAVQAFEQDPACINVIDFDMVPRGDGAVGTEIQRAIVKAVNVTPYNYVKHGMNMTSLEAIFARDPR
ncbi:MAG: histidine phosphatase family protein [Parvibaculum sp.]|uniref:histidine phosphatase family protein n=1 Tax=Parvibaculum sp. TaxID=2024848 RepID=UPI0025D46079|nr:histidine phosphatase family protein [Parvibaculum sp.]MCE9649228.1 histidine phosphatase family protein [Parvibaculum sp.]